jgi:peptidoglycan hydrolase-like protein with peptidoglycan-binding domain
MRLFVVAFSAVAAAITFNALYMQKAPRFASAAIRTHAPSPDDNLTTAATPTAALPKSDQAPVAPEAEKSPPPEKREAVQQAAPKPAPAKLVKAIQRELLARGYGVSQENGVLGVETRTAILAYEFDAEMPLSGEASEAVLKSLIFGRAAGKGGPGPSGRFERRQRLIAEVQDALNKLAYRSGPADGNLDPETREAIRKFENDRQLQAAGRLTERVLLEMVIVRGRPFSADG